MEIVKKKKKPEEKYKWGKGEEKGPGKWKRIQVTFSTSREKDTE